MGTTEFQHISSGICNSSEKRLASGVGPVRKDNIDVVESQTLKSLFRTLDDAMAS